MSGPERLAVIGDPIVHSLSPAMQRAALAEAGLDWTYEAELVRPADLTDWYRRVGKTLRGFNVTIPHKIAVTSLVDDLDRDARAIGAVNTIVSAEGRCTGYNTDPGGFLAALASAGFDAAGCKIVVLGAGGAARSVVHALQARSAAVTVASRHMDTARRLVADGDALSLDDPRLRDRVAAADGLVNATPLGMGHLADVSPLPAGAQLRPETFVVDLVYGRDTPFLAAARASGCPTQDGLEMLVQQGALAFHLWTGVEADISVMRRACLEALREVATC